MLVRVSAIVLCLLSVIALIQRFDSWRDRVGASRLLVVTEARTLTAARQGRVSSRLIESNLGMLRRAEEMDPSEVAVHMARGGQYLLSDRYAAAERSYHQALELEPRAEIYANLARTYLEQGDRQAALEAIELAIRLDHNQFKVFRKVLSATN